MKKYFKNGLRIILPFILACLTLAGCLSNTAEETAAVFTNISDQYSEQFAQLMKQNFSNSVLQTGKTYETRTVVISLSQKSIADCAGKESVSSYLETKKGQKQLNKIYAQQDALLKQLEKAGIEYELKYRYTAVDNAVAVTVDTSHVSEIKKMSGVESVVISRTYSVPKTITTSADGSAVSNAANVYGTGVYNSQEAIDLGYDGTGMVVAIIDTGLDYTHPAFQNMPNADTLGLTKQDVINALLNNPMRATELNGGTLSADDVYHNDKVPFMFDYADNKANVYPSYSNHGTHVAGIVAGYDESGYTDKDGNHVAEPFRGVAPNAQLVICKVFTDDLESTDLGGAETEDILAALEDCVYLGVDVINMSLGTTCGFTTTDDGDDEGEYLNRVYTMIGDAGISLVCAASNDYSAGFGGTFGTNLSSNPDSGTVGSPSTFGSALSVASISGKKTGYLKANGSDVIFFQDSNDENSNPFDFVGDMLKLGDSFEYVVIPGTGGGKDYTDTIQSLVKGRIALVKRGDNTFQEKVELAKKYGAVGIIVWNNVAGTVRMSLGDMEDEEYIPAISIDMKSGQLLVDSAVDRVGTLEVSAAYQAGPFMSDFSSWGATSDLKLKPEITAHGGEITSSVPGGYGEQSGTSMASPNMAGVVALVRSYIEQNFTTDQLNALKKSKDETEAVVINRLVNQLLMSTATTVLDQNALPYSPRKQGAGLGSLHNALYTGAYLWTDNAENDYRPKFELGDDPDRDGVYTIRFNITNFSDGALSFKTNAIFMTETLAVDGMAVAEQAYLLTDNAAQWTVDGKSVADGETFTVPSGKTYAVTMTVTLSDAEKEYIDTSFKNGMYVEGFAKLQYVGSDDQCDLVLPYMGFYGDWNDAPMLDYDAYELGKYQQDNSILEEEKPQASVWATQPYVSYQDEQFTLPMGSFLYLQDDNADQIYAEMEHNAISCYDQYFGEDSTENYLTSYKFRGLYAGLLRNARYVDYELTNTDTGEVLETDTIYRVGKAYAGAGSAAPAFVKFDTDPTELGLVSGEQYTMTFYFYLDYENEDRTGKMETYSFSFYADYEAPVLEDVRVRFYEYKENNKTKQKIYLDLDIYDNLYAQSVMLTYQDGTVLKLATEYVTPVYNANKNGTTTVSIDITDIYDQYKNCLYVQVDDYALNHSNYWLDLSNAKMSLAPSEFELADGEDDITINIYESHTVALKDYEGTGTLSNFEWKSADPAVAVVKNGQIVGMSAGTTTVTLTGSNGAKRSVKVTVTDTVNKLPTPAISFGAVQSGDDTLETGYVEMYPGQSFNLEVNTDPWYYPEGKFTLKWSSSSEDVAIVDQNGRVTTVDEGQTTILATIVMDGKVTNYSASLVLNVKDPFVVSGYTLTEYHGVGDENGVVVIPTDKNIMMISESAFEDNDKITAVIIPKTVISIGKYAFRNCTALEKVYFQSVEEQEIADCDIGVIYQEAFAGCTALETVDLTNVKIVTLGRECFRDCSSLKTIKHMEKATSLYDGVFKNCTALTEVDLSGLYMSGDYVFSGCTSLKTVHTGYATKLGNYIFNGCTSLRNITISGTAVGDYAFSGCSALASVTFAPAAGESTSSTSIGVQAFAGCKNLKKVTFQDGAQIWSIGDRAFQNCTSLKEFSMPDGLSNLGDDILSGSGVTTIGLDDRFDMETVRLMGLTFGNLKVELNNSTKYVLKDGVLYNADMTKLLAVTADAQYVVIPETVTAIGDHAFAGGKVTTLVIPSSVKTIGTAAFANSEIRKVTFAGESKLTEIPAKAFYGSKLSEIEIPASVTVIGEYAFANTNLSRISFAGNNIRTIGDCAFYGCKLLTSICLPDGVAEMGDGVFMNCTQLTDATMPSVKTLGVQTFYGCSELTKVVFGKDAQTLGDSRWLTLEYGEDPLLLPASTFNGCTKLVSVTIGEKTERIDEMVFAGCTALENIDLKNVTDIGDYAFYGCTKLSGVEKLDKVLQIGDYAFYGCNGLTELHLDSVKSIGDYAFAIEKGSAYTQVRFPAVEHIGNMAFMGGSEKQIEIPASLRSLGYGAFSYSKQLTAFTVQDNPYFFTKDDILFRYYITQAADGTYSILSESEWELCAFPGGKNLKGHTYTVPDGTTRIGAYAFAGLSKNAPEKVVLPWSMRVIGVSAFYESGILDYEFHSIQAPTLSTEYREDIYEMMASVSENLTMDKPAINGLYYANFNSLMFRYTELMGGTSDLRMQYPANGVGYDNYVWTTYFGERTKLSTLMDNDTRETIAAIEALDDAQTVKGWLTWEVNDENQAKVNAFAELVKAARRMYNNISDAEQRAMIDDALVEKLTAIETTLRSVKERFRIELNVDDYKASGDYKNEYTVGEVFDPTGLILTIVYDDYSEEQVDLSKVTIPTDALGLYDSPITLTYNDGETTHEWQISLVITKAAEPEDPGTEPEPPAEEPGTSGNENSGNALTIVLIVVAVVVVAGGAVAFVLIKKKKTPQEN